MRGILEYWDTLDIVISGIGTFPEANESEREKYTGEFEIYKQLIQKQAVGDICARYFNLNGEFIKDDYYDRIVGIPVENLQKTPKVICIASGPEKILSILGAVRTGIVDIFICDEQTAKAVLNYVPH
jgi:deoxyribonucleoside regulator